MNTKPTLFTYTILVDAGSAPNPWGGYCTLNICKPAIRRSAQIGDWVMGTGSKNVEGHGDLSGKCVYLMQITEKMPMCDYDAWAAKQAPIKLVDFTNSDPKKKLGDAIYDFTKAKPKLKKSVHSAEFFESDLSGQHTLISNHFIYFGDQAIDLPKNLQNVIKQGPGHKSHSNAHCLDLFLKWKEKQFKIYGKNALVGKPQIDVLKLMCLCE